MVYGDGSSKHGKLSVESTGFEIHYSEPNKKNDGYIETSRLVNKDEYNSILTIIRYHDRMDEKEKTAIHPEQQIF